MKNKKGFISAITIAIFVIIAMVAIAIASGVIGAATSTTAKTAITFTASNTSCVDVTTKCILSTTSFVNASSAADTIGNANFTACDYSGTYWRGYQVVAGATGTRINANSINASFTEVECGYTNNSFVQVMLPYIIVLMAVLVIMGVAAWLEKMK